MKRSSRLAVSSILALAAVLVISGSAAAAWPTQDQWIPGHDANWSYVSDPTTTPQYSSPWLDCVADLTHPSGAGGFWYVDGTSLSDMTLYMRIIVDGNPVSGSGASATLRPNKWNCMIDSTGDSYPEWCVTVDGSANPDTISTRYNTAADTTTNAATGWQQQATQTPTTSGGFTYLVNGMVRVGQVTTNSSLWHNGDADYYIDFQVPLTWLARQSGSSPTAVTPSTPLKFAFGSSNSVDGIDVDLVGLSAQKNVDVVLGSADRVSPESAVMGGYGTLRNTRHVWSTPNSGTWLLNETVALGGTVSSIPLGYGWPNSSSPQYTGSVNVRIHDPAGAIVWQGIIATDASGNIANTSTWQVAAGTLDGIYSVYVADPRSPSSWVLKDTFTVSKYDFSQSTKAVDKATAAARDELTYTIVVRNTGTRVSPAVTVLDLMPSRVTYVAGSTTLDGAARADVNGQSPLLGGLSLGTLAAGASRSITFRVTIDATAPDQHAVINTATLSWTGGTLQRTATTTVNIPVLAVTKQVDKAQAFPGDELLYTTTCTNSGHAAATELVLVDDIPSETVYVFGSATRGGAGMQLEFRHTVGGPYDAIETGGIVGLRWLIATLGPGSSVTLVFKAVVK